MGDVEGRKCGVGSRMSSSEEGKRGSIKRKRELEKRGNDAER